MLEERLVYSLMTMWRKLSGQERCLDIQSIGVFMSGEMPWVTTLTLVSSQPISLITSPANQSEISIDQCQPIKDQQSYVMCGPIRDK